MIGLPEKEFTIEGMKSWVHCLRLHLMPPEKERPVRYHFHDYIEFLYSLSSDAAVWVHGKCFPFRSGDLIVINSGELHDVIANAPSDYICVKFSPHILHASEEALLEYKYVLPFLSETEHQTLFRKADIQNTAIPALAAEIMQEWTEKKPAHELIIRADILKIFSEIFRYWQHNAISVAEIRLTEPIKKAITYISAHYTAVTAHEVARAVGFSYNYFSHAFHRALGTPFCEYILSLRLREAEKLLLMGDDSITDIALKTGFSTASHFISKFKSRKQITPKAFRTRFGKSHTTT